MSTPCRIAGATLACLVLLAGSSSGDDRKRAFAIEDFYRVVTPASPTVAPDGTSVVYTLTTSDIRAVKRTTNLWRVDADGRHAPPADHLGRARHRAPPSRRTERSLAFVSTRSGEAQVCSCRSRGGEPEKRTDFPGGVGATRSGTPTGSGSSSPRRSGPTAAPTPPATASSTRPREKGKLKADLADGLLFRHWDFWGDGKVTHLLLLDLESGGLTRPHPRRLRLPGRGWGAAGTSTSRPTGRSWSSPRTTTRTPRPPRTTDLWTVPVDGLPGGARGARERHRGKPRLGRRSPLLPGRAVARPSDAARHPGTSRTASASPSSTARPATTPRPDRGLRRLGAASVRARTPGRSSSPPT